MRAVFWGLQGRLFRGDCGGEVVEQLGTSPGFERPVPAFGAWSSEPGKADGIDDDLLCFYQG